MKRLSSQLIICSPEHILRNTVIELTDDGIVTRLIDLQHQQAETAHTLFFDGVISSGIVSLKSVLSNNQIDELRSSYNYIDLSIDNNTVFSNKPMIIDFGTNNDHRLINKILTEKHVLLQPINLYEFITGCTYTPSLILKTNHQLRVSGQPELILWQNLNLVNKHILPDTRIKLL